jgi:hypothetical protein
MRCSLRLSRPIDPQEKPQWIVLEGLETERAIEPSRALVEGIDNQANACGLLDGCSGARDSVGQHQLPETSSLRAAIHRKATQEYARKSPR